MATVTIPGALADYLTDQLISDDETRDALDDARRGRGRTLVIEPTSTRVLHVISRFAEHILSIRGAYTRAQVEAARLWIKRAGHSPSAMVHRFDSTGSAYNATQCRDDIRDGDVLVVEREGVVGFLRSAWPAAITAEYGELHTIEGDPRTLDDGRYVASIEAAEKIASGQGFALAEQQLAPVEDDEALYAAQLVTEADADAGTWRGEWIGQQANNALFAVELPAEQGALFDDRAAELAAVEVEPSAVAPNCPPEVTRASVDSYLAREYPALFAAEQRRPLEASAALDSEPPF
ncbi:hypothetical protein [Streptomyces umbrinus]|uniref:hypothetical protein n=1 Tax=Streptomyces umbrinus TaxID=67370 RepID=UPI003C2BABB3